MASISNLMDSTKFMAQTTSNGKEPCYRVEKPIPDPELVANMPRMPFAQWVRQLEEIQAQNRRSTPAAIIDEELESQLANILQLVKNGLKAQIKEAIVSVLKNDMSFNMNGAVRIRVQFVVFPGSFSDRLTTKKITEKINAYLLQESSLHVTKNCGRVLGGQVLDCVQTNHTRGFADIAIPYGCVTVQELLFSCIQC